MLIRSLFNGDLPKLIMFDLDGTLVDSVPDLASAVDSALGSVSLPSVGEENVRLWVGNGAEMLVRRALAYVLASETEPDFFDRVFAQFLSDYERCLADKSQLYSGVQQVLVALERLHVPMAIVTNKPIAFTIPLLIALNLDRFFSEVLGGDSLVRKKPDPLPLQTMMTRYNVRPDQALMVGDSTNDVVAARSAGCAVVAVSYGYNHGESIDEAGADVVVSGLMQLL